MENSRRLFFDIKNEVHDASGIEIPSKWWWKKLDNVYYPNCIVSEEEYHNEVYDFIVDNNLPENSLDEIDLDYFIGDLLDKRNFFMDLFYQLGMKTKKELKIMAKLTKEEIENLKEIHDKIRSILIDYDCKEFGDCIVDEISLAVGILPTTIYYEED
jgi:hypothetical protein